MPHHRIHLTNDTKSEQRTKHCQGEIVNLKKMMEERPDELEALVHEAEDNGKLLDALHLHERLLLALQRYHPDPSEPVDEQKIRLCECLLRFEESEEAHQLRVLSSNQTSAAAAGGGHDRSSFNTSYSSGRESVANSTPQQRQKKLKGSSHGGGGSLLTRHRLQQKAHDPLARHAPLLTEALSLQGLLAFGDRLISDENVLEVTRHSHRLIRARARILQSLATILFKQKRPRAGVPLAQASLKKFKQLLQPPNYVSNEVVKAYLSLCTVLSASNKHKEALQCIITALSMTQLLEEEYSANAPAAVNSAPTASEQDPSRISLSGSERGASARLLFPSPPPKRQFVGSLEAACYHNAAVELEFLGLHELALVCYRAGHDVAMDSIGPDHPLTQHLHKTQRELFVSLNYKHFYPDGRRPGERSTAFDDAERALKQLNFTYVTSTKHQEALARDDAKARAFLQQAADPLCAMSFVAPPSSTLAEL